MLKIFSVHDSYSNEGNIDNHCKNKQTHHLKRNIVTSFSERLTKHLVDKEKTVLMKFSCTHLGNLTRNIIEYTITGTDSKNPLITPGIGCWIPIEQFYIKTVTEAIKNANELQEVVKRSVLS